MLGKVVRAGMMLTVALTVLATATSAEIASTAQMGDVSGFLVSEASCQDVVDAFENATANPTTEEVILVIAVITFGYGYAHAKGITQDEATDEILARCFEDLDQPFARFPRLDR